MSRSRLLAVAVDAADPAALARFWAAGPDARVVDPAPDHPWVVPADPGENLFRLLGPR